MSFRHFVWSHLSAFKTIYLFYVLIIIGAVLYPQLDPEQAPLEGAVQQSGSLLQGVLPTKQSSSVPEVKQDEEAVRSASDGIATSTSSTDDKIDKAVSRNFILRVYSLLMALLAGTVCIVSYFMLVEDLRSYVRVNRWVNIASLTIHLSSIVVVVSVLAISRRTLFQNLSLGLYTMCQGVFVGTMTSFYDVDVVLNTGGITAAVSLGLILFAIQTKINFTVFRGALFAFLLLLGIAYLAMIFVPHVK